MTGTERSDALQSYPYQRQRRYVAKSRTGCLTCKARKVKCDEQKPSCMRCLKLSISCGGYNQPSSELQSRPVEQHTSRGHEFNDFKAPSSPSKVLPNPSIASPPGVPWNATENSRFHFIRTTAFAAVADELDTSLWLNDVFRLSHSHPAVWHATNALSSSLQSFLSPEASTSNLDVTLKHYNLSIKELLRYNHPAITLADKAVILTSALLFATICRVQGDVESMVPHIEAGVRLFNQDGSRKQLSNTSSSQLQTFPLDFEEILAVYARFDNQFRMMIGARPSPPLVPQTKYVHEIRSPHEAYIELEFRINNLLRTSYTSDPDCSSRRTLNCAESRNKSSNLTAFADWDDKLNRFAKTDLGRRSGASIRLLRIRRLYIELVARYDPDKGEMSWDALEKECFLIVDLCEQSQQASQPDHAQIKHLLPLQIFSVSVSPALTVIACRCRNFNIRRRALQLLQNRSPHEAKWDAKYGPGLAEKFVDLEENRDRSLRTCCPFGKICVQHRIAAIEMRFQKQPLVEPRVDWKRSTARTGMTMLLSSPAPRDFPRTKEWNWIGLKYSWALSGK